MFYSFRNKLFAISVLLLVIFMLGVGVYLHETIRGWTESRIKEDLLARAELVVDGLEAGERTGSPAEFVESLGVSDNERITLVDDSGVVLADTHLDSREADNHGDRPEIRRAMEEKETGVATRYSESVDIDMLYVAVPVRDDDSILRVSVPLQEVDDALGQFRLILLVGGLMGLGVAIFMSSIASKLMSRTLQRVLQRARREPNRLAGRTSRSGDSDDDDESRPPDEIAERLEKTLDLLVSERNRFRAVLDGMNEGVVATNGDLRIRLSNRTVHRLLGVDDDLEGRSLREVVPGGVVDELVGGETESAEFELENQPVRQIHLRATPRPDSEGFIFVFHDVTTLRELETMRRDFVANVSHELKTPVTVIQAHAETLLDGALTDPEHARSFTEGIHRNAGRLANLIADLLDLSRIESGEPELDIESIELAEIVDRAVADTRRRIGDGAPAFDCQIDDELRVRADVDGLHRVLLNLMENAARYGRGEAPVEIEGRVRDGVVVVEVRDDGPGIDEQHRGRIFERFYRADSGRSSEGGGTGLGLSIVKHLIEQMDGEVGVKVDKSKGSVFWFTLPAEGS